MPFKDWSIDLGEFRIFVWRVTVKGDLTDFLVALLYWYDADWVCITRYDCSHGFPHQDLLGIGGGLLYKEEFPELDYEEIFNHALRDCKKNYEEYARFFLAH
jgi:hypothetical protein